MKLQGGMPIQRRIYSQQGPVQKKCRGPSTRAADPIFFLEKKLATFFSHHARVCCQFSKTGDLFLLSTLLSLGGPVAQFFPHAKNYRSFCGE